MNIRDATATDAVPIARLLGQLGYETSDEEAARRIARCTTDRDRVIVIDLDGAVAGFASVHVAPRFEFPDDWCQVTALAVDERHRRSGVGRALVAEIERWARARGCGTVRLNSSRHRDAAHPFYRALGYDDLGLTKVTYTKALD